jgi:hypothetical protein
MAAMPGAIHVYKSLWDKELLRVTGAITTHLFHRYGAWFHACAVLA